MKFLVCNDDEKRREVIRNFLTEHGYQTAGETADLNNALTLSSELNPNIVILHAHLNNISGMPFIDKLRSVNDGTMIIVTGDENAEEDGEQYLRNGAAGYVCFPLIEELLLAVIKKITHEEMTEDEKTIADIFNHYDYGYARASLADCLEKKGKPAEAEKWFELAGDTYDADGISRAAEYYDRHGKYERALYWWMKGNEILLDEAYYYLGHYYHKGLGTEKDLEKAVSNLKEAVKYGDKRAMQELGSMYFEGKEIEQNPREGFELLDKAGCWTYFYQREEKLEEMQKIIEDTASLGLKYLNGDGVEKDVNKAIELLDKASRWSDGYDEVIYAELLASAEMELERMSDEARRSNLADKDTETIMREAEKTMTSDMAEAAKLYEVAAERGNVRAMEMASRCFMKSGEPDKARQWARKTAENGGVGTVMTLANESEQLGRKSSKENKKSYYTEAAELYAIAAELGETEAMRKLGEYYYQGLGVKKNLNKALNWLRKANSQIWTSETAELIRKAEEALQPKKEDNVDTSYYDRSISFELWGLLALAVLCGFCWYFRAIGALSYDVPIIIRLPFFFKTIGTLFGIAGIVVMNTSVLYLLGRSFSPDIAIIGSVAGFIAGFVIVFTMKHDGAMEKVFIANAIMAILLIIRILMKKLRK